MKRALNVADPFLLLLAVLWSAWLPLACGQPAPVDPLKNALDGLTVSKPDAFPGYSLVAPMNSKSTYLIDMDGRIVNEWKSEFTPALSCYLLENGHLLRPGSERGFGNGGPGAGGRIQEFDWNGELVWDYSFQDSKQRPHHDICRLPNGHILVIATDPKTEKESIAAGRNPATVKGQLLPECILEIKPTGKTTGEIVWEWHVWDHLIQDFDKSKPYFGDVSEHPELVDLNFTTNLMDRMTQDPEQLARLRSLGYVGGGGPPAEARPQPNGAKAGTEPKSTTPEKPTEPPVGDRGPRGGGPGFGPQSGDWLHFNSVSYNAQLDQIMISVHEFHEVWIIDHSTSPKESASHAGGRGKGGDLLYRWGNPKTYRSGSNADQRLYSQHCAHWISAGLPGAGNLLVFNNGTGRHDGQYSTVDEIVLPVNKLGLYDREEFAAYGPEKATWSFQNTDKASFYSMLISGAQRLPNGNTFICSGNQAILFEVSPQGEIVWQYKHPGGGFGPPEGMGPGGFGPGGMPRPGELVPRFLQQILAVTEDQKESIQKLQTETDARIGKLLTDDQKQKLKAPPAIPGLFGFGRFRPSRFGEVLPAPILESLTLSNEQTVELKSIQQETDTQMAKLWTESQKAQLKEMEEFNSRGPGGGPPGGPRGPGGGGPGGFGPRPGGPGFGPPGFGPQGPGGAGGPPGGGPGGPGGIFRSYRYGTTYPGLAGRNLTPGQKLVDVVAANRPATPDPKKESE